MARLERATGRRWVTLGVPLAIVLGAVLWWFAHAPYAGGGEESGPRARTRESEGGPALPAAAPREGRPALLGAAPPPEQWSGVVVEERTFIDPKVLPPPPPPREFAGAAAVLRVSLRLPDAWRAQGGVIYALPAGSSGRDGAEALPHADVPADATEATLPLPEQRLWDVGFRGQLGHVLVQDVDVRGTTDVVLDARSAAPIRFRVRGKDRPPAGSRVTATFDDGVDHPGRGQSVQVHCSLPLLEGVELQTPPLAAGTTYRISTYAPVEQRAPGGVPGFDWVPTRETARAGEEVELVATRVGLLRVVLEIESNLPEVWLKHWPTDLHLMVGAQGERDREPQHFASTLLGKDGTFRTSVLLLPLVPGRYTMHMFPSPSLFQRAPTPIGIVAGEVLEMRVRATPDPERSPFRHVLEGQEFATNVMVEISPPSAREWHVAGETKEEEQFVWGGWGGGTGSVVEVSGSPRVHRALVFVPPDRASDVFAMPARGTVPVRLLPAGHLVLVPETLPDPRLGAFEVRRADGLPLPRPEPQAASAEANPERYQLQFDVLQPLTMGLIVGPVPEGQLQLEVLLGGTVVARPVATVRAGRHTPVSIPVRAGPDR